jgi:hypothetical protein
MKLDKITASVAAANTFKAVAEEWFAKTEKEGLAPATLKKKRAGFSPLPMRLSVIARLLRYCHMNY